DIQDDLEAQPLGKKIVGRAGGEGVDRSGLERGDSLTDGTELNVLEIFERIHLKTGKRRLCKHVRIRTDPVDAKPLSLQILDAGDFFLADNRPGHAILALPDHNQILGSSSNRPGRSKSADDPYIDFPRQYRSRPQGTGSNKDEFHIESLFFEEPRLFGDPHGRHRNHWRGIKRRERLGLAPALLA